MEINFKIPMAERHKEWVFDQLKRYQDRIPYLKEKYEKDLIEAEKKLNAYICFWNKNEKPVHYGLDKHINDSFHETKIEYISTGEIYVTTLEDAKEWVCVFCKQPRAIKYIATGHDHTDYSYDVCNCSGAKSWGRSWDQLD